jgi:hypothetical protein
MLIWCKGRWPENPVPSGEPDWIYGEVALDTDSVVRLVEVFADGRALRVSIARAGGPSLVHGDFWTDDEVRRQLTPITQDEFARIWAAATDKPSA